MNRLAATLVLVLLSGTLFATESVYPGSKLVFDMNLTEQDFLPALKKALPGLVGIASSRIPGIPEAAQQPSACEAALTYDALAKEVLAAVEGLRSVSVSYYELAKPNAAKLIQFYGPKVGLGEDWRPIVRVEDPKGQGSFRLYVKPGLEEMFSLAVAPKGYVVVHTTGPIDMTRLAELAAKIIPDMMSRQPAPKTEPAPEPSPEPGPAKAPTPEPAPAPAQ